MPRDVVEQDEEAFRRHPVGSGPFRIVGYEPHRRVEMARFEGYGTGELPYVDRLTYDIGLRDDEIAARFLEGELSFVKDPHRDLVGHLESDPMTKGMVLGAVRLHTERLIFDCGSAPFDSVDVRRAFCHAIDKNRYVREVHGDSGVVAQGPIPPGLLGYEPEFAGLEFDPDLSRFLLSRAGFGGGLRTSIWMTKGFVGQAGLDRVSEDLAAVGVDVTMRVAEPAEFTLARERGVVPVAWRSWHADYADPDNFVYVLFHSSNQGLFSSNYRSAEVDQLAERAREVLDREERASIYQRVARTIVSDAPSLFLMHRRVLVAHQPSIEGLRLHLLTPIIRPEEIWFAEDAG